MAMLFMMHLVQISLKNGLKKYNKQVKQVLFDEYRITWLLAENRIESARKYLLKSLYKRIAMPIWQNIAIAIYDIVVQLTLRLLF